MLKMLHILEHLVQKKNDYQLVISFPKEYDSFEYQGIVEGIKIVIESKQVIDEDA